MIARRIPFFRPRPFEPHSFSELYVYLMPSFSSIIQNDTYVSFILTLQMKNDNTQWATPSCHVWQESESLPGAHRSAVPAGWLAKADRNRQLWHTRATLLGRRQYLPSGRYT
jgi:hypothetical protein